MNIRSVSQSVRFMLYIYMYICTMYICSMYRARARGEGRIASMVMRWFMLRGKQGVKKGIQ